MQALCHADSFPLKKINNVTQLAHLTWSEMDKEIMEDPLVNARANTTHVCVLHKPISLPNRETDKKLSSARRLTLLLPGFLFDPNLISGSVNEKAIQIWIDKFLPMFRPVIFMSDQFQHMHHWVC